MAGIAATLHLRRVSAQTTTTEASATATETSKGAATHTIQVGPRSDPHQYVPSSVNASVGDVIVFEFYPRNHSVVRADYDAPCVPAQTSGPVFYSGHFTKFNEENGQMIGPPPTWSLVVNDTKPTFFYCTAIGSCNENGMVGVINPTANMTWEHQNKKAINYPYQLEPWEHIPAEGESPNSSATSSPSPSSSGSHLSGGAIAGIVVGAVAFIGLLVAFFFVMGRNQVYKKWMTSQDGTTERTARWALFNSHGERKSDFDSTQPPGDQATYIPSPDLTNRTYVSGQGQYGWDQSMFQPMPQSPPPRNVAPTELEAPDSVVHYRTDVR